MRCPRINVESRHLQIGHLLPPAKLRQTLTADADKTPSIFWISEWGHFSPDSKAFPQFLQQQIGEYVALSAGTGGDERQFNGWILFQSRLSVNLTGQDISALYGLHSNVVIMDEHDVCNMFGPLMDGFLRRNMNGCQNDKLVCVYTVYCFNVLRRWNLLEFPFRISRTR